jgi:hypothetical protein
MRTIRVCLLALASAVACEDASEGEDAAERAARQAVKKVEQAGEALREKTADGSLLVQSPTAPDGGD